MATIRQRTESKREAQVRKRGWPTQTCTFTTKADAQQWASECEAEMRRGPFVDTANLRVATVRSTLERYLSELTPKKKGAEPERCRLGALLRHPTFWVLLLAAGWLKQCISGRRLSGVTLAMAGLALARGWSNRLRQMVNAFRAATGSGSLNASSALLAWAG